MRDCSGESPREERSQLSVSDACSQQDREWWLSRQEPSLGKAHVTQAEKLEAAESPPETSLERLSGWRLHGTTFICMMCIFLANLEVAIVSTALIAITDDLQSFGRSSWVISSYLLTYTGFLIIWSKISDSLGRRICLCSALVIFTIASGACGGAQSTDQLIIFRSLQGIGGSGLLSLTFVILPEMVEPKKYALYASFTSCAFVLGFLFGPLFGGAIVGNTTWRWIFFLNLPLGLATLALLMFFMPVGFPDVRAKSTPVHMEKLKEIDFLGAFLVFGACAFIVSALEEAGSAYAWSSVTIIVLLALSGVCTVAFPLWEWIVDRGVGSVQAIFTWRLLCNRVFMAALLITFFGGVVFTVSVIQIPQEWQTISSVSALIAGVRLLPFTLCYSVGTVVAMILTSKLQVPPVFVVLMGAALQILGTCLMALVPLRTGAGKYLSEILLSIGLGENLGVMVQLTPQLIRGKDQAAAMGAITQFRALGGVVGFAITSNVFNAYLASNLPALLQPPQVAAVLASVTSAIQRLPPTVADPVRGIFANAYDLEIKIIIGFAVAQALAVGLMWEKKFRRLI